MHLSICLQAISKFESILIMQLYKMIKFLYFGALCNETEHPSLPK